MKNFRARLPARLLFWKNFRPQNPLFLRHFHGKILGTGKILGPTLYIQRILEIEPDFWAGCLLMVVHACMLTSGLTTPFCCRLTASRDPNISVHRTHIYLKTESPNRTMRVTRSQARTTEGNDGVGTRGAESQRTLGLFLP